MKSKFIVKQRQLYNSLTPCHCPAIQEVVRFTADGWNHLVFDERRPRSHSEQHYRVGLINHLADIISNATTAVQKVIPGKKICYLWVLTGEITDNRGDKAVVKIILRKIGAGNTHFLSVMAKKNKRKPRV